MPLLIRAARASRRGTGLRARGSRATTVRNRVRRRCRRRYSSGHHGGLHGCSSPNGWREHQSRAWRSMRRPPNEIVAGLLSPTVHTRGDQRAPACCTAIRIPATPMTSDGRLGVLDFGSTLEMPGGMPSTFFGRLVSVLMRGDESEILRGLRDEGFSPRTRGRRGKAGRLPRAVHRTGTARSLPLHPRLAAIEFGRVNDPRNPDFAVALQLTILPSTCSRTGSGSVVSACSAS